MHTWAGNYPEIPEVSYDFGKSDFLYARWKERHLVPDHKQDILGACFAGFYCRLLPFEIDYRCGISKKYWDNYRLVLSQEFRNVRSFQIFHSWQKPKAYTQGSLYHLPCLHPALPTNTREDTHLRISITTDTSGLIISTFYKGIYQASEILIHIRN
jgi:hypothetical protein